jgi:hypothetical protein
MCLAFLPSTVSRKRRRGEPLPAITQSSPEVIGGASMSLVTLRLFDAPSIVDEHDQPSGVPGAFTDLWPSEACRLADELPDCAEHAEALRRETDD